MASNIYGEPIPDLAVTNTPTELPQRADGRPCNIFGEIIDDPQTVAEQNLLLPAAPKRMLLTQGTVDSVFAGLGAFAGLIAATSAAQDIATEDWARGFCHDYVDHEGEVNGLGEPAYFLED
ncbi:hypothetical protein ACBQ16_01165 [Halopseudomonas bauzanensis]|uniref:Uncharacterized protein n=1 Tax=Halopseudomonas litoralis TaxID=797277 RepID=A0A1H1VHJ5_9GAMM|nr:hypothetical protein [Halopseudomonas litoralis]SDS83766.1 hypothetical protein SAMN05216198_2917 [Halopseudomonas litoralis]